MFYFQNGAFFKLGPADPQPIAAELAPILVDGEQVYLCFKGMRDHVVFTNKRLIAVSVQGLTGKKAGRERTSRRSDRMETLWGAYLKSLRSRSGRCSRQPRKAP